MKYDRFADPYLRPKSLGCKAQEHPKNEYISWYNTIPEDLLKSPCMGSSNSLRNPSNGKTGLNNTSKISNAHNFGHKVNRVKNVLLARYKFGHLILHADKGYELTTPVNHSPLYVLAVVRNLRV